MAIHLQTDRYIPTSYIHTDREAYTHTYKQGEAYIHTYIPTCVHTYRQPG